MSLVTVTLPDGSTKHVESGAPVKAVAEAISPRLADAAIVAYVNDKLVDLTYPMTADATVRIVTNKNPEALEVYRHSTAHLLAAAVTALFPKVQCGIGPPIDDGFFYDFVVERPFVPEDLEAIEAKMKELASKDFVYERQMWPRQEAIDFFTKRGEPLKVQLIEEKTAGQPEVSVYTIKDKDTFLDFCVGPHVPSTGRLKAFKLTSTSNAYWKGDAKNAPMQRVYGTAFFSQKELDEHLTRLEEAKKRDHRKVGKELGLFTFHPWAPGADVLDCQEARRSTTRSSNYMRGVAHPRRIRRGQDADRVQQGAVGARPATGTTTGEHVPGEVGGRRRDGPEADELPGPLPALLGSEKRSYRDLPMRFHEQTPLHRNEASGALVGPDARAAVLAGRRPLLRDARSRSPREVEALIKLDPAHLRRLRPRVRGEAVDASGEVHRRRRDVGRRRGGAQERAREVAAGVHAQRRRRHLLRPEDRLRHHGRARPQVAVRHDSARLRSA